MKRESRIYSYLHIEDMKLLEKITEEEKLSKSEMVRKILKREISKWQKRNKRK